MPELFGTNVLYRKWESRPQGALVAFNAVCRHRTAFDGLVLISPDFKNGLRFPVSAYLTLAACILFRPKKTIPIPFTSAMGREKVFRDILDWADPRT